jgi:hypothetical protein
MFAKLLGGLIVAAALAAPMSYSTLAAAPRTGADAITARVEKSPGCRPGFDCCKNIGQACCRR